MTACIGNVSTALRKPLGSRLNRAECQFQFRTRKSLLRVELESRKLYALYNAGLRVYPKNERDFLTETIKNRKKQY